MTINGIVIDTNGEPIPGALVHDGSNGITTASNGTFELQSSSSNITAEMVGFEGVTRPAAPYMEFRLAPDENSILSTVEIVAQAKQVGIELLVIVLLILLLFMYL